MTTMMLTSIWATAPPTPLTPLRTTILACLHSTRVLTQRKTGKSSPLLLLPNYHDVCVCSDDKLYCAGVTSSSVARGRLPGIIWLLAGRLLDFRCMAGGIWPRRVWDETAEWVVLRWNEPAC